MIKSTAKNPKRKDGSQYHIACKKGDLSAYLLLTGDPGRVKKITQSWENKQTITCNREFCSTTGYFNGHKISCLSIGIGAPSMAIAIEETARIDVNTFIRVGSTGALKKGINPGDLVINSGSVRMEGTSKDYVMSEYPAQANYEVVLALIQACEELNFVYHVGVGASTDSFYIGEGRLGFDGYIQSYNKDILSDLQAAGIINIEMETSALFALGGIYGLRTGSVCAVFDNLETNEFLAKGEKQAGLVASRALALLNEWDKIKKNKKKKYFFPSLIK
ncbi:nucleoside phosphorylase [Patescibacteria group bacterium]|nr:nucleoside phosphorylase [Patescibacteria group bacterium]